MHPYVKNVHDADPLQKRATHPVPGRTDRSIFFWICASMLSPRELSPERPRKMHRPPELFFPSSPAMAFSRGRTSDLRSALALNGGNPVAPELGDEALGQIQEIVLHAVRAHAEREVALRIVLAVVLPDPGVARDSCGKSHAAASSLLGSCGSPGTVCRCTVFTMWKRSEIVMLRRVESWRPLLTVFR